jgi:hypothetical protein
MPKHTEIKRNESGVDAVLFSVPSKAQDASQIDEKETKTKGKKLVNTRIFK